MKIYQLRNNSDYQAIKFVDDNYIKISRKIDGKTSLKEEWGTCYIKFIDTKLKKIKDFDSIGYDRPIFSPKAVEILKEFFVSGELLPLKTVKGKEFYLYNIFPEIDCLDIQNSYLKWNINKSSILSESKPTFIKEKIDIEIFRTKYMVTSVLVTDIFVQKILDNNLMGFMFIPLWDSEKGYLEDIYDNRITT
jgi:hypothetical protein